MLQQLNLTFWCIKLWVTLTKSSSWESVSGSEMYSSVRTSHCAVYCRLFFFIFSNSNLVLMCRHGNQTLLLVCFNTRLSAQCFFWLHQLNSPAVICTVAALSRKSEAIHLDLTKGVALKYHKYLKQETTVEMDNTVPQIICPLY